MIENPLISVILSYKDEDPKYFYPSINSILNQSYNNFEFIIIQDAGKHLKLPDDKRIRFFKNEKCIGLGLSMNKAIAIAKGDFIARHDSDDISLSNRLETQLKFILNNPKYDLIGSSSYIIDDENKILGVWNEATLHKDLCDKPWKEIPIKHPTWFFKKSWFLNRTKKYNKNMRGQDQHFLISNFKNSKYYQISTPLIFYRSNKISTKFKLIGRLSVVEANYNNRDFLNVLFSIIYSFLNFLFLFNSKINKKKITVEIDKYFYMSNKKELVSNKLNSLLF